MSGLVIRAATNLSVQGPNPGQEDFALSVREKRIFVVADGFGGPSPGAVAAQTACEAVRSFLDREAGDLEATLPFMLRSYFSLAGNVLFNALIHANRKVTALNRNKNVHEKGGASVLAGFMDGDLLALANVGACSAWLFRGGESKELVAPRTYGRLCDPFSKQLSSALSVPLTALGISDDVEPEIFEYRIQAGDWLLFGTDGLTHELKEQVLNIKQRSFNPEAAIEAVNDLLKSAKLRDNIAISLLIF